MKYRDGHKHRVVAIDVGVEQLTVRVIYRTKIWIRTKSTSQLVYGGPRHFHCSDLTPHGECRFRKSTVPCTDFKHPQRKTLVRKPLNHSAQDLYQPIMQLPVGQMRASDPVIYVRQVIPFLKIHLEISFLVALAYSADVLTPVMAS